ncbi:MAG: hypothetical protein ACREBJ_00060 [Nitrosotalea sp.]
MYVGQTINEADERYLGHKSSSRKLQKTGHYAMTKHKVTEKIVLEIREKYASGNYSQIELVREYNLSTTIAFKIVNRKSWRHI